jgi:hypothetical protein
MPKTLALEAALMASLISSPPAQIDSFGAAALALTAGQAMASQNLPGVGIVIKKKPGNAPIAKATSDEEGNFKYKGLEPGAYSVCFESDRGNGSSCADVEVGKEGMIRGQTVFDETRKSRKHNYVGHVTLLR